MGGAGRALRAAWGWATQVSSIDRSIGPSVERLLEIAGALQRQDAEAGAARGRARRREIALEMGRALRFAARSLPSSDTVSDKRQD